MMQCVNHGILGLSILMSGAHLSSGPHVSGGCKTRRCTLMLRGEQLVMRSLKYSGPAPDRKSSMNLAAGLIHSMLNDPNWGRRLPGS